MAPCMCIGAKKSSPNCRDFESRLIPTLSSLLIFPCYLPANPSSCNILSINLPTRSAWLPGVTAALHIRGGSTKDFYGNALIKRAGQDNVDPGSYDDSEVELLDVASYAGMVDYEPTELVATARSGTRLADLEAELYRHGQMLAFEPPHFGSGATLGGCIAAGLSGPRRASAGAARDFVLGVRMLDGRGNDLSFGGQVMKNVAGYDVSRLMTGSMGTLGVLLEVSLKVLPIPAMELTLRFEMDEAEAIEEHE